MTHQKVEFRPDDWEADYLGLMQQALLMGEPREDRTGVGTNSLFGVRLKVPINTNFFPVVTTKKLYWKGVVTELLWFLRGETNLQYLHDHKTHIWDEWADEDGELGPVYGKQWRDWNGVDQIERLVHGIRESPYSRRHILSAWNVGEISDMALPPCHLLSQFYVTGAGRLHCQLYQRSADLFLGVPFNIASYALLTTLLAFECGLKPGDLIHVMGDAHVYKNHEEAVLTQIQRRPRMRPRLHIESGISLLNPQIMEPEDFHLLLYDHHPAIKAEVAI